MVEIRKETIGQIKKLEHYLSMCSKKELDEILAYGEKYRQEWECMKNKFWSKHNRNDFVNLLMSYENNERMFFEWLSGEEQKLIGSLEWISKRKFIDEYLHDRIFYGWCSTDLREHPRFRYSSGMIFDIDYAKRFAMEWKKKLVTWAYIYLEETDINLQCLDIIVNEWKDGLKPWMGISFEKCYMGEKRAQILAEVWRDSLQLWMILDLNENHIWAGWARALSKMKLKEWMYIWLYLNDLWDKWAEAISKIELESGVSLMLTWNHIWAGWASALSKMELKKWVRLDFSWNKIRDEWAQAFIDNMELKEWVKVDLENNDLSDKMKDRLKEWEKFYRDKWVNCTVEV